ncbi:VOC family protein [Enterovibrio coralii]|uniref:Glyoxalase n=1 Tax=Enterovibrio coralii TaxID=294935 RepID=A0A135I8M3_9GAMM|nr:VOC family protein [Enterovibrio coralii]KXF81767.1 glyoxalase [Enterovibrio coralii]
MNPVGWFEIAVADMERAIAFYEKTFNFTLQRHDMQGTDMAWFPVEKDVAYGATGTLIAGEGYVPGASSIMIYIGVESIDDVLARVPAEAIIEPKTDIGEFGIYAHILDSEGNKIGIHSH